MTLNTKNDEKINSIRKKLNFLYGQKAKELIQEIEQLIVRYSNEPQQSKTWVNEEDVMLITYGDSIKEKGINPLKTLHEFLNHYAKETLSAVHILPFYPYTSDDGFSVVDYRKVNTDVGDWSDVNALAEDYDLMFDAVINHISKSSDWFQGYLKGNEKYKGYFIEEDPGKDYSKVTRPRALPLLTPFETVNGVKYIWTTFSGDQIDLNFKNPQVLLEVLDILSMYARNGARFIRLDAIGFMWKEVGTSCMHLEETHMLIKLIREVLDMSAPGTILITETNVPHKDNISYFGNGFDEAQMVYQFPLPPLTLYSFYAGNASKLLDWAANLEPTTEGTTFFNFLASHDGIGMRPTEGILTEKEKELMVYNTLEYGGRVSYKDNGDGTRSPYELNINYLDALNHPNDEDDVRIKRFIAAHSILLSVEGVPGIYVHSLLASRNDSIGAEESGINRRINREKLDKDRLFAELESNTLRSKIFGEFSDIIQLRRKQKAFSPEAKQDVIYFDDRVFSIIRTHEATGDQILVLVNVADDTVTLETGCTGEDLISTEQVNQSVILHPYQVMWIKTKKVLS